MELRLRTCREDGARPGSRRRSICVRCGEDRWTLPIPELAAPKVGILSSRDEVLGRRGEISLLIAPSCDMRAAGGRGGGKGEAACYQGES